MKSFIISAVYILLSFMSLGDGKIIFIKFMMWCGIVNG